MPDLETKSVTDFTSWGPSDDGRIKPDLSGPGCQSDGDGGVSRACAEHGYVGATAIGVGEGRAREQDVGESSHTVSQERVLVFSRSSAGKMQEIRDVAPGNGMRSKDMWGDVLRIPATQDSMCATTRGAKVAGTLTLWDYCKKLSRKDAARPWR